MAELTPKTIGELPSASSLSGSDIFPLSSSGASKKTLWSTMLSAIRTNIASVLFPLAVASGGTGATNASGARSNLSAADAAFEPIYINANQGTKTLSFSGLVLFLLVSNFASDNRQGMWIVSSTAAGAASVKEVVGASAITVTAGTGQITVNSGTLSVFYSIIPLSSSTAGRITIT